MKIPFKKITAGNDKKIGFDVQINDAKDGARQSVAAWNDTTGNGYQDTSVYGVLTLRASLHNQTTADITLTIVAVPHQVRRQASLRARTALLRSS